MERILVNILSKETLPNLIAIRHFSPHRVIALSTAEFSTQHKDFEVYCNLPHTKITVDAFNPEPIFEAIVNLKNELPPNAELIINYTGGTKVMSTAVVLQTILQLQNRAQLVYINTQMQRVELMQINDGKLEVGKETITVKLNIEDSIALRGESIKSIERSLSANALERVELTCLLSKHPALIPLFDKQKRFFEGRNLKHSFELDIAHKFYLSYNTKKIELEMKEGLMEYGHTDGGRYFTGEWLEEFVMYTLQQSECFDYVAKGLVLNFKSDVLRSKLWDKNELDIVVSNKLTTAILECKAGAVTQDHVYKLDAIRNYLLGPFGKAAFACRFAPSDNIKEKCKDLKISIIADQQLESIVEEINHLLNYYNHES